MQNKTSLLPVPLIQHAPVTTAVRTRDLAIANTLQLLRLHAKTINMKTYLAVKDNGMPVGLLLMQVFFLRFLWSKLKLSNSVFVKVGQFITGNSTSTFVKFTERHFELFLMKQWRTNQKKIVLSVSLSTYRGPAFAIDENNVDDNHPSCALQTKYFSRFLKRYHDLLRRRS